MSWIESHPAMIQSFFALVLIVITFVYVVYTKRILSHSIKSSQDSKMPVLVFRFTVNEETDGVSERIINIGNGPALDIELKSNAGFEKSNATGGLAMTRKYRIGSPLEPWPENYPVDNSIGPDTGNSDTQVCYLNNKGISILKDPALELLLTYRDIFGRECQTRFVNLENQFEPPG